MRGAGSPDSRTCRHTKIGFEAPFDDPQHLRRRLRITQPVAIDRAIGFGVPPGQRLQWHLRQPPQLTSLDKLLTAIYLFWEVEPHLALAWILSRHPHRFPKAALRLALTSDLALVYTGEHYVIDLLLGAGLALSVHGADAILLHRRRR